MTSPSSAIPGRAPRAGHPGAVWALRLLAALVSAALTSGRAASPSIARVWDERAIGAIRADTPHPPAQARNLFSLSVCMYDAWAAYDPQAVGYVYRRKHAAADVAAARREAISYAAYRMLRERHVYSRTAEATLAVDDAQLMVLGYPAGNQSRDPSTPAGVGNAVYDAVSAWFIGDGSRQSDGTPFPLADPPVAYPDHPAGQGGYVFINPPLAAVLPGIDDGNGNTVVDINRWQRLKIVNALDQQGFQQAPVQSYLGAQWLGVRPFALVRADPSRPWIDPGPPPLFGKASHADFVSNVLEVIRRGSELTPDDGVVVDISPGALGNNPPGSNAGHGHALNPATGRPYAPNPVRRGDYARVLAEFWADGPNSETPPGHWNVIANAVADHPALVKRIGGAGPVVDDLEWDVKAYFALNAALHDAACAAWSLKRWYDGWRPICAVRYLALLGQSGDPSRPSYNPNGLPLVPGLVELVTADSVVSGRHAGLTPGKVAVRGWPGQPSDPAAGHRGVRWLHGEAWVPYQRTNFVTPAFPGYVSGHSTFSRAAAEVLAAITGSDFFPGGIATHTAPADKGLAFEKGPSQDVQLQWATYFDAADQAGLSRIWGGIHPPADDFAGRLAGSQAGRGAWELARRYWDGSAAGPEVAVRRGEGGLYTVRFTTRRGFRYQVQSTPDLDTPFADDGPPFGLPFDAVTVVRTNFPGDGSRFHRVVGIASP